MFFTVGVEVLDALLRNDVPVSEEHCQLLLAHAEVALTPISFHALDQLSDRAGDQFAAFSHNVIIRCCRRLRDLVSVKPRLDKQGIQDACDAIKAQLSRPNCDVPFGTIFPIVKKVARSPEWTPPILGMLAPLMQSDHPGLGDLVEFLVALLRRQNFTTYVAEVCLLLIDFICAHEDAIADWAAELVNLLVAKGNLDELWDQDIAIIGKTLAVILQSQFVTEAAPTVVAWAVAHAEATEETFIKHMAIEVIASVFAVIGVVEVPAEVLQWWDELIDHGYLATNYFRTLTAAAFVNMAAAGIDIPGEQVAAVMTNQVPLNEEYFEQNRSLVFAGAGPMPIERAELCRLPGFVKGNV
jgi:hypothetical protein